MISVREVVERNDEELDEAGTGHPPPHVSRKSDIPLAAKKALGR